jgi:PPM family protein phosphatase
LLVLEHYGVTDPGKVRKNNEDCLLVGEGRDETLFVVADGIGGFEAGEVASSIAVDVLKDVAPSAPLEDAIREANRQILAAARGDEKLSGMGTTVVAMRFSGNKREPVAEISHVGDSRAYLLRAGDLKPVTEDHSLVAELVRSGDLTRAQASEHPQKNLITRALGAEEEVKVDTAVLPIEPGDRLVLCSDGLSDMISEANILNLLASSLEDPKKAARALIRAALDAGGLDNVTVIVVDVREEEDPAEAPRRGDTQEMRAIAPEEIGAPSRQGPSRRRRARGKHGASHAKGESSGGSLSVFVRALAMVLVLVIAITPIYLWGASRYFLGFDEGSVVVYRGLPLAPLGYQLNQEVRRTNLTESELEARYRDQISEHRLYSESEVDAVVRDLGASEEPTQR